MKKTYVKRGGKRVGGARRSGYSRYPKKYQTLGVMAKSTRTNKPYAYLRDEALVCPSIQRNPAGIVPATYYCTHRYVDQFVLTTQAVTGAMGNEVAFRLNSLYDPDFTFTGHQPSGFDQMSPLYARYQVYKVDVQIKVIGPFTSGNCVGINVRNFESTWGLNGQQPAQVQEQSQCVVLDADTATTWNQTISCNVIEGISMSQYMDDVFYSGQVSNSPSRTPYLSIAAASYTGAGGASSQTGVLVSFVFHTKWTNRKVLPPS